MIIMWKFAKSSFEGNCELFGVNIFDFKWKNTNKKVKVRDPLYNQEYEITIYTVEIGNKEVTFAAGEFSNGVYGFYVNEETSIKNI